MKNNGIVEKLLEFFSQFLKKKYKKNDTILHEGKIPNGIYYLHEGIVKQSFLSIKGEEVILNIYRAPSFFPVREIFSEKENKYRYDALTDCVMYVAPKNEVKSFLQNNIDILMDLLDRLTRGIEGYQERCSYMLVGTAYERVVIELLLYIKRFGREEDKLVFSSKISAKQIAQQSGLTRETVTREIAKLKKKLLVKFEKNNLIIPDVVALEQELEKN